MTELDEAARKALTEGLASSALWSLLLGVMESRAARRDASELLEQYRQDRFVRPSSVDQRTLIELDMHLFRAAAEFEAVEIAPLAPLGACSVVALTSQNRVVSTARGTEVVADPTNVLALECARRLNEQPQAAVRLATSHRVTRAQPVPDQPGFAAHFRMFSLSSASHERPDHGFLVEAITDHLQTHLRALDSLELDGYRFRKRSIVLLSTPKLRHVADRVAESMPGVDFSREELTHEYYDGLRFMINAHTENGDSVPLIDGGSFDWLKKLCNNNKLVFVASGLGTQVAASAFRDRD